MKITIDIPDETILVTVSIATQEENRTVSLGVFPIPTAGLKDGNTVDFKTSYDKQKETTEKGSVQE